jgi:hypothetical protein
MTPDLKQCRALGWLGERIDRCYPAVANLYGSLWWHGSMWGYEHAARWLRNVTLFHAYAGRAHPALSEVGEELLTLVESGKALAQYETNGLAVYNEEEVLAGLLAYWRHSRDPRVLAAARRMGDSIATQHPKLAGNHYYKGMGIGPLLNLAAATGDPVYATAAETIANDQQLAILKLEGAHGAAAGMILCGLVDLHLHTRQEKYRDWAIELWHAMRARMFVTGGIGEVLMFAGPPGESDLHDETCQHSWWLMANLALWRATGEAHYLDLVERILYNHFIFSQLHRGEDGGFCALGDVDQGFRGQHNFICCDNEGCLGLFELLRHAVTADSATRSVSVNLLLPMEIDLTPTLHVPASLSIATPYPARGQASLRITCATPAPFTLHLRIPGGQHVAGLQLNEQSVASSSQPGRVSITRTWQNNDVITMTFPIPSGVEADDTGAGARSGTVQINGRTLKAKRTAVLHGPVVAALFRTGHGNDLSWVWNGDYPEPLDSGGCVAMNYPASKAVYLDSGGTPYQTGSTPQLTEVSTTGTGGTVSLKWSEPLGPVATVLNTVEVFPGLPVTMDWTQTITGLKETDRVLCSSLRYATAKRTRNIRYGTFAFPYPFPALTTRDDLSANNGFIAGGGSFSLAETLTDGGEIKKTGTLRLSNGSFRTIIHYDPAAIDKATGKVMPDWAGVYLVPATTLNPTISRRLIFPLFDDPLGQDVTRHELDRARQVQAVMTTRADGTTVINLSGLAIQYTPIFIPKASGAKAGWILHNATAAAALSDYDEQSLVTRLPVPGCYQITRDPLLKKTTPVTIRRRIKTPLEMEAGKTKKVAKKYGAI